MRFEKNLSRNEIPDADDNGHDDLGNTIIDEEELDKHPHENVIQNKADHGQKDENDEFAASAHVVFALKDETHGGEVVENDGDDEGDGGADQIRNPEHFGEKHQDTEIDQKSDESDHAELHDLSDKLFHEHPSLQAKRAPGPPLRSRQQKKAPQRRA